MAWPRERQANSERGSFPAATLRRRIAGPRMLDQRSWLCCPSGGAVSFRSTTIMAALLALTAIAYPRAQRVAMPTPEAPVTSTAGGRQVRVALAAGGLVNPWDIAFLPGNEGMLVTESAGRLRLVRNGTVT